MGARVEKHGFIGSVCVDEMAERGALGHGARDQRLSFDAAAAVGSTTPR